MYGGDMIVRRSQPLQATRDARDDQFVRVHPDTAAALGLADGESVIVRAGDGRAAMTLRVDDAMAPGAVWVPLGTPAAARLGRVDGAVELERAST